MLCACMSGIKMCTFFLLYFYFIIYYSIVVVFVSLSNKKEAAEIYIFFQRESEKERMRKKFMKIYGKSFCQE